MTTSPHPLLSFLTQKAFSPNLVSCEFRGLGSAAPFVLRSLLHDNHKEHSSSENGNQYGKNICVNTCTHKTPCYIHKRVLVPNTHSVCLCMWTTPWPPFGEQEQLSEMQGWFRASKPFHSRQLHALCHGCRAVCTSGTTAIVPVL